MWYPSRPGLVDLPPTPTKDVNKDWGHQPGWTNKRNPMQGWRNMSENNFMAEANIRAGYTSTFMDVSLPNKWQRKLVTAKQQKRWREAKRVCQYLPFTARQHSSSAVDGTASRPRCGRGRSHSSWPWRRRLCARLGWGTRHLEHLLPRRGGKASVGAMRDNPGVVCFGKWWWCIWSMSVEVDACEHGRKRRVPGLSIFTLPYIRQATSSASYKLPTTPDGGGSKPQTWISDVSAPILNSSHLSPTFWMSNVRRAGQPVTVWLKYTCCWRIRLFTNTSRTKNQSRSSSRPTREDKQG